MFVGDRKTFRDGHGCEKFHISVDKAFLNEKHHTSGWRSGALSSAPLINSSMKNRLVFFTHASFSASRMGSNRSEKKRRPDSMI